MLSTNYLLLLITNTQRISTNKKIKQLNGAFHCSGKVRASVLGPQMHVHTHTHSTLHAHPSVNRAVGTHTQTNLNKYSSERFIVDDDHKGGGSRRCHE